MMVKYISEAIATGMHNDFQCNYLLLRLHDSILVVTSSKCNECPVQKTGKI